MSSPGLQNKNPTEILSPHLIPTQTKSITPIQTKNSQPIPSPPKSWSQNTEKQEFIVYNRRNKTEKEVELQNAAQQNQESEPV